MPDILLFWRPRSDLTLSPAEVARDVLWGEEVEGLVDLPVKDIIERLKAEFPEHRETSGLLVLHADGGRVEATWTWQHVKAELHDVPGSDCERLVAVLAEFGCQSFEG
jgi:hypothetical protein